MSGIVISAVALADLVAGAAASPHVEICGLLFGDSERIHATEAVPNVAADPWHRFEIDPARLIAAHRAQRDGGPCLIGHYHSHPGGRAEPSAADLAAAEPGPLWLILAAEGARLWELNEGRFVELDLVVDRLVWG